MSFGEYIKTLEILERLERLAAHHHHRRLVRISVLGYTDEAMPDNTQTFDTSHTSITFQVTATYSDGSTAVLDPATPGLAFSFDAVSGSPGTFSGNVLSGVGAGDCTVTASLDGFTSVDTVTINAAAPTLTGIEVSGS